MNTNIKNDNEKPLRPATLKRRREILDASLECFLKNGFEETSIEQIRNKSGASHGSIYHLFKSKSEIACTLYVEGMERLYRDILSAMSEKTSAYGKIHALVDTHFKSIIREPELVLYTTRISVSDLAFENLDPFASVKTDFPLEIHNQLEPFIEKGELVNLGPKFYYAAIIGPAAALGRGWLRYPLEFDLLDYVDVTSQAAWRSVLNTMPLAAPEKPSNPEIETL